MSTLSQSMVMETLRSLGFASISTTYALVGTTSHGDIRVLIINNYTNQLLIFSLDGVNDHFALDSGASLTLDVCTNRTNTGGSFYMGSRRSLYVRDIGTGPTSGSVYFSTVYGEDR